jgi:hypothetical protein
VSKNTEVLPEIRFQNILPNHKILEYTLWSLEMLLLNVTRKIKDVTGSEAIVVVN